MRLCVLSSDTDATYQCAETDRLLCYWLTSVRPDSYAVEIRFRYFLTSPFFLPLMPPVT